MTAPIQTTYNQAIINPGLRQEHVQTNWNRRLVNQKIASILKTTINIISGLMCTCLGLFFCNSDNKKSTHAYLTTAGTLALVSALLIRRYLKITKELQKTTHA